MRILKKQFLFIAYLMLFTPFIFANSTLPPRLDTINTGIILEDLDSLINLWYVKNTIKQNSAFTESSDSVIPYFTDSIVNKKLAAIESIIPLTYNKTVQSFIDLYTRKRRKQVAIMLGMADYYFPVFEEVLDAQGLPLELKYIPVIESALNKLAVSRAGATGIWQFMYPTAKLYKLNITSFVDERKDVYLSTVAAANFLKDMFNIYGDWLLVIAAYNCGPGNVNKAIRRSGGKTSFWAIYNYLPRETRGYVPAFIAANYVFHYYKDYNIVKFPVDFSITDTVLVKNKIHFGQISDILKIPVEKIRELNPQYRRNIIPATPEKKYPIRLPNDLVTTFVTLEDSIAHYKDSIFFASDFQPNEPQNYKHNYFYSIDEKNSKKLYYTVKQGDNLGFIAEWYDVSVQKIKLWNDIRRSLIREGQKLVIFVPKSKYEYYKKINSMSFDRKQRMKGYSVSKTATVTKKDITIDNKSDNYIYYKVRNGDNFWSIAKKYPGISNYDIMKLNGITDEKSLKPGQILKIRKKQ